MKSRALWVCFLLLVFAAPLQAGGDPVKVPFDTLSTQHMVVMVKINGKGPYRMIFDTGAPFTLINSKTAKDSGVSTKDGVAAGASLLSPVPQAAMKTVELGELKAENLNVVIMDHPTVAAIDKLLGPVEGIVGLSLFGKYKMTIDYRAKEMTFAPVDFSPPDIMKTMMTVLLNPKTPKKLLAPAGQWGFTLKEADKDEGPGVKVTTVLPGSPAEAGGLKSGDRILTLDGRWTDTVADCYLAASFVRPGSESQLVVVRDGKELKLKVKVAAGL